MSLFSALSVASQALLSNTIALKSTTKNINNAYTEGYTREEPIFVDLPGAGVSIEELRRVFNYAIFKQYIGEKSQNESLKAYHSILSQIEDVFNDATGSGFEEEINAFFSSLHDIALNPDDIAARENFLSAAQSLVGRIRQSYSALEEIKRTYTEKLRNDVRELNNLLEQLADINRFIPAAKTTSSYNQYLDQRDKLIEEIGSLVQAQVIINEDGTVNLYTAKGFPLVLKNRAFKLDIEEDANGLKVLTQGIDISNELKEGAIGGILQGIKAVNEWENRLNEFTNTFAKKINDIHSQGVNLYGETGIILFTSDNGSGTIDASNITLAITDPKEFAAAAPNEELNSGNGKVLELIDLGEEKVIDDLSFAEYYTSEIAAAIGSKVAATKNLLDNSTFRLESVTEKLKEISGVNIDEELVKMTQFQRAYEAAAKVVTVSDELLQTILNMVG